MTSNFEHVPLFPIREDHIGEKTFSEFWSELAPSFLDDPWEERTVFDECMYGFPYKLNQRHASIAATFITWLGTNTGDAFLETAKRLESSGAYFEGEGYVAAWALANQRKCSVNFGVRRIESLLAPPENFARSVYGIGSCLTRRPEITLEDSEVIEFVVSWLASETGQEFLTRCAHAIRAHHDQQHANFRKEHGLD